MKLCLLTVLLLLDELLLLGGDGGGEGHEAEQYHIFGLHAKIEKKAL